MKVSQRKYQLGRKVVQTKDYVGLKAGRVGWVTSEWPRTRVLFDDGREPDISEELCNVLKSTDEFCEDLEELRERVHSTKNKFHKKRVKQNAR